MKGKLVTLFLSIAAASMVFSGCGAGNTETSGAGSSKDGGQLVYWSMWSENEPQAQVIKAATEKFTTDTGIKVDVEFKGRSGQREGLQPALDTKQQIDVFDEDVNRVNGSWGKYLLNLESMAKDYESEHGNKTLFAIARNAYGQANNGDKTLHSIPYQPSIFGIFYNKALFDKAGITDPPTTWDEFDAACDKLLKAGIAPITCDDAYVTSLMGYHFSRYIGQDGVKSLVLGKETNGQNVKWSDDRVLKAAESLADFASKGYFSKNIATNKYPAGQNQEFAPGEAAMIPCGSWLPNEVKDTVAKDFSWGYFNYPSVTGGTDDNTANNIANQVFAINKDSKMQEQAFKYITYLTTGDVDKEFISKAKSIPVDSANWNDWPAELKNVKAGFDATKSYYDWACGIESNVDITAVLQENGLKLITGKMSAPDFISAMKSAEGQ